MKKLISLSAFLILFIGLGLNVHSQISITNNTGVAQIVDFHTSLINGCTVNGGGSITVGAYSTASTPFPTGNGSYVIFSKCQPVPPCGVELIASHSLCSSSSATGLASCIGYYNITINSASVNIITGNISQSVVIN